MRTNRTKRDVHLFPENLKTNEWIQFPANGFSEPVCGVIYTADESAVTPIPCCGVPLGGISTGCLDIDVRGVWGFSSVFNPDSLHQYPQYKVHPWRWRLPRKYPSIEPILGLAVADDVWVLASNTITEGGNIDWCTEPENAELYGDDSPQTHITVDKIEGVKAVEGICYWGHYPVADVVYELDSPIAVATRAWAPFIPGNIQASNIPAAVFEVHLSCKSESTQSGTLVFNFPGPDAAEARSPEFTRTCIFEDFNGTFVSSRGGVSYVLGAIGEKLRFGGGLGRNGKAWSMIGTRLPKPAFREETGVELYQEGGCSAALDFELKPGEQKIIKFLLTWFAPVVEGAKKYWPEREKIEDGILHTRWIRSDWAGDTNYYTQMYAARYSGAVDIARRMALEHEGLLRRILAWQEVLYTAENYPIWLRDSLVNNLALIPEVSHWFQARPPLGDWTFPEGAFALNESPRGCPQMSCIPCDWYGNHPIVFFFPELALSNLRMFKHYQLESGEVPFALGKIGDLPDMATPSYWWQVSLNGCCYVDLVDRQWMRTGDDAVLQEFYDSVKKCTTFTMELCRGPGGVISMPEIGGMEWFEFGEFEGMAVHVGGIRLAHLRMVERMAVSMGDDAYARRCRDWLADGTRAMEEEMWTDGYYLNFLDKENGKKSDDVMAYQLDGEWTTAYHGLPGAFRADRVKTALQTIRRCNIALTPNLGAANFSRPDGKPLSADSKVAEYGQYAMFTPEVVILGMTSIYAGEKELGLELIRKYWKNLVIRQGHPWDTPNIVRGDNAKRIYGTDYYQNMMLWALPAALAGQDLNQLVACGGLIDRMLHAASGRGLAKTSHEV